MSEFVPIDHPHARSARSILIAFGRGADVGVVYRSIILSSAEPGVTDRYDPSMRSLMKFATFYWPGGSPDRGQDVETIVQGELRPDAATAEAERVRRLLLGATIGASALARVPAPLRNLWSVTEAAVPGVAVTGFKERCQDLGLPLAVCAISDVTSDDPGRTIMHLWHPAMVPPGSGLGELQQAVAAHGI